MKKAILKINYTSWSEVNFKKGDIVTKNGKDYIVTKSSIDNIGKYITEKEVENNPDIFEELPILFWCEDYTDGSFPVKSCNNCNYAFGKGGCIGNNCKNNQYSHWQRELKGKPIYKGMKCWRVLDLGKDGAEITYDDWVGFNLNSKFFSNETNARNYYNKLVEESKPKTKWLADEFQVLNISFNCDTCSINRNKKICDEYCTDDGLENWKFIPTSSKGKIFEDEKDALLYHAKLKYPIGIKVYYNDEIYTITGIPYWFINYIVVDSDSKGKSLLQIYHPTFFWTKTVNEILKMIEIEGSKTII